MAICTRAATSVFPWKPRAISTKSSAMSSETRMRANLVARAEDWLWSSLRRGTGRPSVSNPLRLAAAPALRLAPNRQPTAVRSRTGCAPTSGSSRLSLRQRRLDRRDREATQNRFDTTSSRKAEEGKINAARSNISPLYIAYYPNSVAGTFSSPRWHRWQRAIGRVADDRPGGSGEQMSDNSLTPGPSPGTGEGKVCPHPDHGYMVRGGEDLPSRPLSET